MDLKGLLAERKEPSTGDTGCEAIFFDPSRRAERSELEKLLAGGRVASVVDRYRAQLQALERCLDPGLEPGPELDARVRARLGGLPEHRHGLWCYFPWCATLVHTLPEEDFRRLRLDRNRYKITPQEQAILAGKRIGIVGLSVGHGIAITLALEGVGGHLRLADMDRIELVNLNRIRAGLPDLGRNKAVQAARDVIGIDPFTEVRPFPDGLTDRSLEDFLLDGGKLDLIIEECDDLYLKFRLREVARAHRIPVVMETSDRGMIDVERFDLEPRRPILHGLAGDTRAEALVGLSTEQKVPVVFKLMGSGISDRAAASLVEIGQSISSWPQTASGVTLGAALVADAARRILLGQLTASGRHYVDLEQLVSDKSSVELAECRDLEVEAPAEALSAARIGEAASAGGLDRAAVRYLVQHAVLAPSGGNCQPWSFRFSDGRLQAHIDPQRAESSLDFDRSATLLAFGAVAENLELAASALGRRMDLAPPPLDGPPDLAFSAGFPTGGNAHPMPDLLAQVPRRVTNRRLGERVALQPTEAAALVEAGRSAGAEVELIDDPAALEELGAILGEGDRLRFLSKTMHREMMSEIRWSRAQAEQSRDGLDVATLELSPSDVAAMRVISSWKAMRLVGSVGGGRALSKPSKRAVAAASALGLVSVAEASPEAYLRAGRAMQRVWLRATALGLAFQPMTALTYVFARLDRGGGEGLSSRERKVLTELRARYLEIFSPGPGAFEAMLFRVARAAAPSARALRRRVEDVLEIR